MANRKSSEKDVQLAAQTKKFGSNCKSVLQFGIFPKELFVVVKPLLKIPTIDSTDLKNYRLILNLSFLLKLVERIIANRLLTHFSSHDLLVKFQSTCRKFHSSEAALLYV